MVGTFSSRNIIRTDNDPKFRNAVLNNSYPVLFTLWSSCICSVLKYLVRPWVNGSNHGNYFAVTVTNYHLVYWNLQGLHPPFLLPSCLAFDFLCRTMHGHQTNPILQRQQENTCKFRYSPFAHVTNINTVHFPQWEKFWYKIRLTLIHGTTQMSFRVCFKALVT